MLRWLRQLLIFKGHLLLWFAALIAIFWLTVVLLLELLAQRPQLLVWLGEQMQVRVELGQFQAKTRPLEAALDFDLKEVALHWDGGSLSIDRVQGDINLWNLLLPDLAVGRQARFDRPVLQLDALSGGVGENPLSNPWLRLWEQTAIHDAALIWRADSDWRMDSITLQLIKSHLWQASLSARLTLSGMPEVPLRASATIHHSFGFQPEVHFRAQATMANAPLMASAQDVVLDLQGIWDADDLRADVSLMSQQWNEDVFAPSQIIGQLSSTDLISWQISVRKVALGGEAIELPTWPRLTLHPQTGARLEFHQVQLGPDDGWVRALPEQARQLWETWRPELWVNQLVLQWQPDGRFSGVRGGIDLLRWQSTGLVPGVTFKHLQFAYTQSDARLVIDAQSNSEVNWPAFAQSDLPLQAASMVVQLDPEHLWEGWQLHPWQIRLGSVDLALSASPLAQGGVHLTAEASARELQAAKALIPMALLSQDLQHWLQQALQQGGETRAGWQYQGSWADLLSGTWPEDAMQAWLDARQVTLRFAPNYPPLTHADLLLRWQADSLRIETASAQLAGATLSQVGADVLWQADEQVALRVQGKVSSSLSGLQGFLLRSPLAHTLGVESFLKQVRFVGAAQGELALWLPLDGYPDHEPVRVRGYADLQDAGLSWGEVLALSSVRGRLLYSHLGLESSALQGVWQQGSVRASLRVAEEVRVRIHQASTPVPSQINSVVAGVLNWQGDWQLDKQQRWQLQALGDGRGLKIVLPEPFAKAPSQGRSWKLSLQGEDKITGQWRDPRLHADWNLVPAGEGVELAGLSVREAGRALVPVDTGVVVEVGVLPLEPWLDWLTERANVSSKGETISLFDQGQVFADRLTGYDQAWAAVRLGWQRQVDGWSVRVHGSDIKGRIDWLEQQKTIHFDQLRLQRQVLTAEQKRALPPLTSCPAQTPAEWPDIRVLVDRLQLDTEREGKMTSVSLRNLQARIGQAGQRRQIRDLTLEHQSLRLSADYEWQTQANRSSLFLHLKADQMPHLLALAGLEAAVAGGAVQLQGVVGWSGGLSCYDLRRLEGGLSLHAVDGSFSEASPGLARLFGLLSFDAFTRRLKIGLSDVTAPGLAFDDLRTQARLDKGVLQIDSLRLKGPSVEIKLQGRTHLMHETHDLDAQVTPLVGDTIPTLAILGGATPITAIGVYLLQKIVPPLSGNLFTFPYHVGGSWQEPELKAAAQERK